MTDDRKPETSSVAEVAITPAPPAPAPSAARSRAGRVAVFVSVLALITSISQPWWSAYVKPATPLADVAALEKKVEALPAPVDLAPVLSRLSALEQRPAGTADTSLTSRIEALESEQRNTSNKVEISQLKNEIDTLRKETALQGPQGMAQRTLLAASLQLSAAWQNGSPFDAPWLALLASASVVDADLAQHLGDVTPEILPWRDKGLPTLQKLQADFAPAARLAVNTAVPAGESWWQRSWRRVQSLVTIRRQGAVVPQEDLGVDAVLARAETALQAGDLQSAASEVEKLDDKAAEAMAGWLGGAHARLAAEALLVQLTERAGTYVGANTVHLPEATIQPDAGDTTP